MVWGTGKWLGPLYGHGWKERGFVGGVADHCVEGVGHWGCWGQRGLGDVTQKSLSAVIPRESEQNLFTTG